AKSGSKTRRVACWVAATADAGGRHGEKAADAVCLARALVVTEKEQLIFHNRAANSSAELLPPCARDQPTCNRVRLVRTLGERVAGLLRIRAPEPETATVEVVGPGFCLRCYDA